MNFCFLARPALDIFSPKLFLEIKNSFDSSAKGYFITTNDKETRTVRRVYPDAVVFETSQYLRNNWDSFSLDKLSIYEKKYDCAPIWKYIYTDRFLIQRDYQYAAKVTIGLFAFFEKIFTEYEINYYYSETIATLQCYIAFLVGKKTHTKYYGQMLAREMDATHHFVFDDPYQTILGFDNNYLNNKYTEDEIKRASDFLEQFENNMIQPAFVQKQRVKPKITYKDLLLPIKYMKARLDKDLNDKYSYMYYQTYTHTLNSVVYYFRYQRCKKYYKDADYSQTYVYFPLHFQPEASTLVCAEKYEKQLYFIDSIAKSLPADTVLYVKEHFALLGNRDEQFYIELKKYPNVVLINPFEDSKKIIEKCQAIFTLTGTAGFEAMLLRKPVFVAGKVFYRSAPGIINIDDVYQNYINKMDSWKKPMREDVVKYICEYFRAIQPGIQYARKESVSDENIKLLAASLMRFINEDQNKEEKNV